MATARSLGPLAVSAETLCAPWSFFGFRVLRFSVSGLEVLLKGFVGLQRVLQVFVTGCGALSLTFDGLGFRIVHKGAHEKQITQLVVWPRIGLGTMEIVAASCGVALVMMTVTYYAA